MNLSNPSSLLVKSGRPNIVVLVIDAARYDHFSCYGYYRPTTPTIDALARQGLQFENATTVDTASPLAHFALLSGQADWEGRAWLARANLAERARFLARQLGRKLGLVKHVAGYEHSQHSLLKLLRELGYTTAGISANFLVSPETLQPYEGFDEFAERQLLDGYLADKECVAQLAEYGLVNKNSNRQAVYFRAGRLFDLADAATRRAGEQEQPFFLFMNVMDCHDPYLPHPEQRERFGFEPQSNFNGDLRHRPAAEQAMADGISQAWTYSDDLTPADIDLLRWNYDRCLNYVDTQVGRFMGMLEERGQAENTVFFILADHGELLGEHGRLGHSLEPTPELMRIPLIVSGPAYVQAGVRVTTPAGIVDIRPAITDLLGVADPFRERSGESLFATRRKEILPARNDSGVGRQTALLGEGRAAVSAEELSVMQERLRDLGYLD